MKLTYIEWDDAHAPTAGPWIDVSDECLSIEKPLVIVSVGFVVQENEHYVQLCATAGYTAANSGVFEGDVVAGVMSIPQRQISKRVEIELKDTVEPVKRIEYVRKRPRRRAAPAA